MFVTFGGEVVAIGPLYVETVSFQMAIHDNGVRRSDGPAISRTCNSRHYNGHHWRRVFVLATRFVIDDFQL